MKITTESNIMGTLRHDLPASLVVFLVAVPLSLGIAMAAGAPLAAGLVAAVVGGIVAGRLGGSPVQVSGPTASLTLVIAGLVQTQGWRATCLITIMAGGVQLLLGAFKAARAALAVSPAVVHGMLAGVGIIIALAQLHVVLGGSPQRSAWANLAQLPSQIIHLHGHKVMVGILTIGVLLLWTRMPKHVRAVPAPLAALITAAATAWAFSWDVTRIDLTGAITAWAPPELPHGDWQNIAGAVLLVALVAGAESLLCCVATESMHTGPRADLDRELTGQGVANMVSGALGGLPVAGVIVRSTTNLQAGARSRWSAILHGVWVLLFALCLGWTIKLIPMEALAALLVFIGIKTISLGHLKKAHGHNEVPVYLMTMTGVILVGLAEGVVAGLALAALLALRRLTRVTVTKRQEPGGRLHATVAGSLTFLGVPRLTQELRAIPAGTAVDLDLNIDFMDNAAFDALHSWRLDHERLGGTVTIDELHDEWYTMAASGGRMFPAKSPPKAPGRWWLPWTHRGRPLSAMKAVECRLTQGADEFHKRTAPLLRPIFTQLATEQRPSHLFITCSDSRIVPHLITSSGPGDLFTVRNIGNLVPCAGSEPHDDSVAAAIEYATRVLTVHTITVCGHSGCGAMAALLNGPATTESLPQLTRWLRHGHPSLASLGEEARGEPGTALDTLCRLNIQQQLENLRTYRKVDEQVEAGRLKLVGLYFDIGSARVHVVPSRTPASPASDDPLPSQL
ncbi:MAG: bifunctional SulP family inorganic anion transporter/carbonic anhydrase [Nonomuraea sp.]|nr:bifunctional SulP family inorganic anion transporter/carbonic anhydrase [Nonomuraea sp.]NUP66000.1 bifunctional SulP family inorganic anion transporter/carbonic anhydrase [Nonomuraea sp.]NUP83379.1 bifunctional SulP family inorganic anion transporter/carbonic anhydrase [Nonomuraea sp.]NUS07027.1 bifunctional SulP family inorganic anion transporter/carbonic anhydrase [Nonomuraea sp.]NUT39926.1 bifunctional SulP family inorganic anion transporter/carbonic anhydrase [Thermoactinospora sp.]